MVREVTRERPVFRYTDYYRMVAGHVPVNSSNEDRVT